MLLVDEDSSNGARCEAILAKLRFAVAPAQTVDDAVRVMAALRPNIIVASVGDVRRLKDETPSGVPVVVLNEDEHNDPEAMIAAIRRAIRSGRPG